MLATVLFTDIVGSTQKVAALGDGRWGELLSLHHERVRAELERFRGREIATAGDGFLATFDGPARAVRCGQAIAQAVRDLGIEIRAGVHTGEIELDGGDVRGIAVHIGARVGALAGASEVWASSTVERSDRGQRPHVRARRGARAQGCPGPLASLPCSGLTGTRRSRARSSATGATTLSTLLNILSCRRISLPLCILRL